MSNKPLRKRLKNWLIFQFIRGLIWIVRRIPRPLALWLFRNLGLLAFRLLRDAREKTIRHLRVAFGEQRRDEEIHLLARQVFRQLGLNAAEAMRIPNLIAAGLQTFDPSVMKLPTQKGEAGPAAAGANATSYHYSIFQ